jgi:hypothetical protein
MNDVLRVPGTDVPADSSTPEGRAYLAELLRGCAEAQAAALASAGLDEDWVWDEAERMAENGETGPVMIPGEASDPAPIFEAALVAYRSVRIQRSVWRAQEAEARSRAIPQRTASGERRPREHRSAGGRLRRGPPGDDEGPEPPPDLLDDLAGGVRLAGGGAARRVSPLQRVQQAVGALATVDEIEAVVLHVVARIEWLQRRAS